MSEPRCTKCGISVFKAPLFRETDSKRLPPGVWVCKPCGGTPESPAVEALVDFIARKGA